MIKIKTIQELFLRRNAWVWNKVNIAFVDLNEGYDEIQEI